MKTNYENIATIRLLELLTRHENQFEKEFIAEGSATHLDYLRIGAVLASRFVPASESTIYLEPGDVVISHREACGWLAWQVMETNERSISAMSVHIDNSARRQHNPLRTLRSGVWIASPRPATPITKGNR